MVCQSVLKKKKKSNGFLVIELRVMPANLNVVEAPQAVTAGILFRSNPHPLYRLGKHVPAVALKLVWKSVDQVTRGVRETPVLHMFLHRYPTALPGRWCLLPHTVLGEMRQPQRRQPHQLLQLFLNSQ